MRLHPLEQREELRTRPRLGQRSEADVVPDVEAMVVDPDRLTRGQRHGLHPLAEAGDQVQPGRDEPADLGETETAVGVNEVPALEDAERPDVHRGLWPFEPQEAGIDRGEPIVGSRHPQQARADQADSTTAPYRCCTA